MGYGGRPGLGGHSGAPISGMRFTSGEPSGEPGELKTLPRSQVGDAVPFFLQLPTPPRPQHPQLAETHLLNQGGEGGEACPWLPSPALSLLVSQKPNSFQTDSQKVQRKEEKF